MESGNVNENADAEGGKALTPQLEGGAVDPAAVNSALNSISQHFKEILGGGGGRSNDQSPLPTKTPSGAAILLKMILNELETQSSSIVSQNASPHAAEIVVSAERRGKIPPPLPPNKPQSCPKIITPKHPVDSRLPNLFGGRQRLMQMQVASGTTSPRSCLKKMSAECFGSQPIKVTETTPDKSNNNESAEDKMGGIRKNSVRFSDEVELPVDQITLANIPDDVRGVSDEALDEPDLATESVTTLSNTLSSGYDFLNEVLQPMAFLKRFVSTDMIMSQTKKPEQ